MIPLADISFTGSGLKRPECVLAHASGILVAPDWTDAGGVSLVARDGRSVRHLCLTARRMIRCGPTVLRWKTAAVS